MLYSKQGAKINANHGLRDWGLRHRRYRIGPSVFRQIVNIFRQKNLNNVREINPHARLDQTSFAQCSLHFEGTATVSSSHLLLLQSWTLRHLICQAKVTLQKHSCTSVVSSTLTLKKKCYPFLLSYRTDRISWAVFELIMIFTISDFVD